MRAYLKLILLFYIFPCLVSGSLLIPAFKHHKTCSDIESHKDQCAFVTSYCYGFSGYFLKLYYCSALLKPLSVIVMLAGLLFLFGAVSVVAADFFCPNLQTISSKLQLSESMAGVTVLAFGNGSPDLFSTFTAINSGSGSLAIGELIGAAFFIVSIVSGCMGIISPFKSKRVTFMRDASFLLGAVIILTWIVYHRRILWYHGPLLIFYYLTYVVVVILGAYRFAEDEPPRGLPETKPGEQELATEVTPLIGSSEEQRRQKPPRLEIPSQGFHTQSEHWGHIIKPVSPSSPHYSRKSSYSNLPRTGSTNGSISSRLYRHAMSPRVGIRTSIFSAVDFQEQVSSIRRASSTHVLPLGNNRSLSGLVRRSSRTFSPNLMLPKSADHLKAPENHDYFHFMTHHDPVPHSAFASQDTKNFDVPEIVLGLAEEGEHPLTCPEETDPEPSKPWDEVICVLFPTLQGWAQKTTFAKCNALVAVPIVLILTLTLPVTEAEDMKIDDIEVVDIPQVTVSKAYLTVPTSEDCPEATDNNTVTESTLSWCRWLLATQAICSLTFVACVMALNGFVAPHCVFIGFLVGCVLSGLVLHYTKEKEPPKWQWMLSFAGFVIALNWIFLLANEMVGLLQALGTIFDISEAIMGLTIFALGNSLGDLVANTAIAKMGFPTMAISACYAGPLLNMVLGVGISSTYQAWITGKPYELDVAPTILVSSCGLITVLVSTLVVVNINGYHINQNLGWWMISVYIACCIINILLEFRFLN